MAALHLESLPPGATVRSPYATTAPDLTECATEPGGPVLHLDVGDGASGTSTTTSMESPRPKRFIRNDPSPRPSARSAHPTLRRPSVAARRGCSARRHRDFPRRRGFGAAISMSPTSPRPYAKTVTTPRSAAALPPTGAISAPARTDSQCSRGLAAAAASARLSIGHRRWCARSVLRLVPAPPMARRSFAARSLDRRSHDRHPRAGATARRAAR